MSPSNRDWMLEAVELSKKGYPAPNPHVGCVIVSDGLVVGRGFHNYAGGDHAEVVALREAGDLAKSAEVFVTLEPCAHFGRTPPCADALIQAGVRAVHFAVPDSSPQAGGGAAKLRAAGIEVTAGLCEKEARETNWMWLRAMANQRAVVILKLARTKDGFMSRLDGTSKWITSEEARADARLLRAECGSVLVGVGTVLADKPQLTVRNSEVVNEPVRIVIGGADKEHLVRGILGESPEVIYISSKEGKEIDLEGLTEELFKRGLIGVLVEGGAKTIGSFINQRVFDQLVIYESENMFGEGVRWDAFVHEMPDLELVAQTKIGPDLKLIYVPK